MPVLQRPVGGGSRVSSLLDGHRASRLEKHQCWHILELECLDICRLDGLLIKLVLIDIDRTDAQPVGAQDDLVRVEARLRVDGGRVSVASTIYMLSIYVGSIYLLGAPG